MTADAHPDTIKVYSFAKGEAQFRDPLPGERESSFDVLKKDPSVKAFFERTFSTKLSAAYSEKPVLFKKNSADIGNVTIVLVFPNGSKVLLTNSEWGDIEYIPPPQQKAK